MYLLSGAAIQTTTRGGLKLHSFILGQIWRQKSKVSVTAQVKVWAGPAPGGWEGSRGSSVSLPLSASSGRLYSWAQALPPK